MTEPGTATLPGPGGTVPDAREGAGRWRKAWTRLDRSGLRPFWVAATVALGAQLLLFLGISTFRYHRFDLYTDFGTYAQAFSVIAHGNLDPFDTFQTYPFWQNHFELAMWPIGLLGAVWPHPIVLLWLQDAAVVATEVVAVLWIGQICAERVDRAYRRPVALIALVATVANAWWWEATIFDVHFETLGMAFALLCAYALWQGRHRTAWAAAFVGMLFGDVVALSILFVGAAALLSGRVRDRDGGRWHAVGLAAFAVAWLVLVTAVHGNRGSAVPIYYGWIVHEPSNASSWAVYGALAAHPAADLHVLRTHAGTMWRVVATGGAFGLLTPWGLFQAVGVLVPVALNVNGSFWLLPVGAFQTVTAVPFVLVGTVMVLVWVGTGRPSWPPGRGSHGRAELRAWRRPAAWVLGAAALVLSLSQSLPLWGQAFSGWDTPSILSSVNGSAATQLRAVQSELPPGSELVVSGGVVGRFTDRQAVYPVEPAPQNPIPITAPTVVFVLTDQGEEGVTPSGEQADAAFVATRLGGRLLLRKAGVTAYVWHPPRGTAPLVLPTTDAGAPHP